VLVIDNLEQGVGAIGCKSSMNGCKWVQVMQGWLQVIDNLVQGVGASYVGSWCKSLVTWGKSFRSGCNWVEVIPEWVQVGPNHLGVGASGHKLTRCLSK
jgi:hypothetical protein